ncbi:dienelactone hydrolase family protein [Vibrio sp. PP-XX7]
MCLEAESEHAHGVIIDYLMQRPDVGNKIGLYGLCMGGLLVARTAVAHQDKVTACVSTGGAYELHTVLLKQSSFIPVFSYRAGVPLDGVIDFSTGFDMQRLLPACVECPLLIVHNQPDFLIPSSNVKRIFAEASTEDKQFVIFKGAEHNAHNDNAEACALISDWFASHLLLD